MKFSEDQQRAIEARGTNVLVSAGAGSGKTAVLTERVVNLLNDNLKINNILVLTFTNNAAKEMKDRIRLKLEDKNDHENLLLLDNSYITTFDAFSLSVLERYHDILDLSPGIGILSEEVLSYITRQNIKKILGNEKEATNIFIGFCEENNIAYNLSDNSDTAIADTLNDENENFKITSDNKQTNYMIRYAVALAVFALGVFIINTYFIGI